MNEWAIPLRQSIWIKSDILPEILGNFLKEIGPLVASRSLHVFAAQLVANVDNDVVLEKENRVLSRKRILNSEFLLSKLYSVSESLQRYFPNKTN